MTFRPIFRCEHCGYIDFSRALRVEGVAENVTFAVHEQCPRCGLVSQPLVADFTVVGDIVRYTLRSPTTAAELDAIVKLLHSGASVREALAAANLDERTASMLGRLSPKVVIAILSLVLPVLMWLDDRASTRELIDRLDVQNDLLRTLVAEVAGDHPHGTDDREQPHHEPPPVGDPERQDVERADPQAEGGHDG
jgi:ribosomal protein S27AE